MPAGELQNSPLSCARFMSGVRGPMKSCHTNTLLGAVTWVVPLLPAPRGRRREVEDRRDGVNSVRAVLRSRLETHCGVGEASRRGPRGMGGGGNTVSVVQVENEAGLLGDSRDHSSYTTRALIPEQLQKHTNEKDASCGPPPLMAQLLMQEQRSEVTCEKCLSLDEKPLYVISLLISEP